MEKDLERKLRKEILKLKGLCFKWVSPPLMGTPDRIVLLPIRRIFFVETKFGKKGILSPQQKAFHKMLNLVGFKVYIISNEKELEDFLNEIRTA